MLKALKKFWVQKSRRVFFITSASILLFLYIVTIVVSTWRLAYGTMDTLFGAGEQYIVSGDPAKYYRYTLDEGITDKASALKAGNELNELIASEGFVLLKNENSLPLAEGSRVSIFGKNSADLVYGGSGSGGMDSSTAMTVAQSLTNAGFDVNQALVSFYRGSASGGGRGSAPSMDQVLYSYGTGEAPVSSLRSNSSVTNSLSTYRNGAALVVFSRISGEGYDLPRFQSGISSAKNGANSHYLELDKNESDLLDYVCEQFDNVIVVINSSTSMELGFLNDENDEDYHEQIRGAVWIGHPGGTGIAALGKLLDGEYSFSGRTVDTYVRDFTKDPTWNNISYGKSERDNAYINSSGNKTSNYFVEYEEGIYVGYRYWETRGYDEYAEHQNWDWYENNVAFPFGYGLSYADFEWEIAQVRVNGAAADKNDVIALTANTKIEIDVTVTNTSNYTVPTKDVVQLYTHAPYIKGGIEKAQVVLADFAKTEALGPAGSNNSSTTVTLSVSAYDFASYDYADKGGVTGKGYELDAGDYSIAIAKNAHDAVLAMVEDTELVVKAHVESAFAISQDPVTEHEVKNRFDDVSEYFDDDGRYGDIDGVQLMSRADFEGTFPQAPTTAGKTDTKGQFSVKNYRVDDKSSDPWYSSKMPTTGKQTAKKWLNLYDLIDDELDEDGYVISSSVDYNNPLWDNLLDQLTVDEMAVLIGSGNFNTARIASIDKPQTIEPDGPGGFTNFMGIGDNAPVYDTVFYASECVIGATWNVEMTEAMGRMVGNEALVGNARGDGMPYSGWYAPAANIHRSQFSGRNNEYYSEDGVLAGKMAAGVVKGASEKGLYTYMKHFVLNDQETNRSSSGLITWATEQAMREVYFRPFEIAVKNGLRGVMSSFNRLGMTWAGGSYELITEVLRNEWGFKGSVVTDYATPRYMSADQMIRAGGDIVLHQDKLPSTSGATATQVAQLRRATKNILYVTANSMAMNGHGSGVEWDQAMAGWKKLLLGIVFGALTGAVLIVDVVFLVLAWKMSDERYKELVAARAEKKRLKLEKKAKKKNKSVDISTDGEASSIDSEAPPVDGEPSTEDHDE